MSLKYTAQQSQNRFALPVIATERANEIENGNSPVFANTHNHKSSVIALQEIEAEVLDTDVLIEKIITKLQQTISATQNNSDQEKAADVKELESSKYDTSQVDEYVNESNDFSLSDEELSMLNDDDIDFKN
jgi:DNA-directed RNA polymerase omega subunit